MKKMSETKTEDQNFWYWRKIRKFVKRLGCPVSSSELATKLLCSDHDKFLTHVSKPNFDFVFDFDFDFDFLVLDRSYAPKKWNGNFAIAPNSI